MDEAKTKLSALKTREMMPAGQAWPRVQCINVCLVQVLRHMSLIRAEVY